MLLGENLPRYLLRCHLWEPWSCAKTKEFIITTTTKTEQRHRCVNDVDMFVVAQTFCTPCAHARQTNRALLRPPRGEGHRNLKICNNMQLIINSDTLHKQSQDSTIQVPGASSILSTYSWPWPWQIKQQLCTVVTARLEAFSTGVVTLDYE